MRYARVLVGLVALAAFFGSNHPAAPLRAQTAPSSTPPLMAPEEITVQPSVVAVSPHTEFQAPVTAQAEANVQPLTADEGDGSKREFLYGAAAVAAFLAVVLLIFAVRGGRSRQT